MNMDQEQGETNNEKSNLRLVIGNSNTQDENGSPHQKISEINDIYDSIYGIVQSKLEFYENKQGKNTSRPSTPVKKISYEYVGSEPNSPKNHLVNGLNTVKTEVEAQNSTEPQHPLTPPTPAVRKTLTEVPSNPDLLRNCSIKCTNCESANFVNDRQEVLTEINANIKVELEEIKQELKKEIEKNNELNFEIANIETALEMYYKEAKFQKSTISSIYSNMKNYSKNDKEDRERYTYKRIKAIADYVETLKVKLQHQDRVIKDNFLENPYSTDLMMKYDAMRQQLDKVSDDNQELRSEIKKKQDEEVEIIKELNRQKFQVEEKCREIESYYKTQLASKDIEMAGNLDKHVKDIKEMQDALEKKNEEMLKMKAIYEAKIDNYKDELVIIYRKLKNASM